MELNVDKGDLEILAGFIEESIEHFEGIEEKILQLEQSRDSELINSIFRSVHTVKGTSSFLGLKEIEYFSHKLETLLDEVRNNRIEINSDIIDILLEGADILFKMILELKAALNSPDSQTDKEGKVVLNIKEVDFSESETKIKELLASTEKTLETPAAAKEKVAAEPPKEKTSVKFEFDKSLKTDYIQEAEEHVTNIEELLLKLETNNKDFELYNDLFRALHSIKGNTDLVISTITDEEQKKSHPLNYMREIAHKAESIIQLKRDKKNPINLPEFDLFFSACDALKILLGEFKNGKGLNFNPVAVIENLKSASESKKDPKGKNDNAILENVFNSAQSATEFAVANTIIQCIEAFADGIDGLNDIEKMDKSQKKISRSLKTLLNLGKKISHTLLIETSEKSIELINIFSDPESDDVEKNRIITELANNLDTLKEKGERRKASVTAQKVAGEQEDAEKGPDKKTELTTIKVPLERLDKMMNLVGELVVFKNNFQYVYKELSVIDNIGSINKKIKNIGDSLSRVSEELQITIMSARMIPVNSVFSKFPRMVRDLSKKMNKKINLVIEGEETELDKTVIEAIGDPMVHLIRNCVDHGIELPADRQNCGKPEEGTIRLKAYNFGQSVIIEIIDDGKGVNPEVIRKKVLEKGLLSEEVLNKMSEGDIKNLIFLPGFSTAAAVTEVSGRGVGMDVVKTNIEKIGGSARLESELGVGTTITLVLPLTLSISRGLNVECCGQNFYLPLDYVIETVKIPVDSIVKHKDMEIIMIRDKLVAFFRLEKLLGLARNNGNNKDEAASGSKKSNNLNVVMLEINNNTIAMEVDRVLDESSFMVKPLTGIVSNIEVASGAVISAKGDLILVLNPPLLFA